MMEKFRREKSKPNIPQAALDRIEREKKAGGIGMGGLMEEWLRDPSWGDMVAAETERNSEVSRDDQECLWMLPKQLYDDYPKHFADAIMKEAKANPSVMYKPNPNFPTNRAFDNVRVLVEKSLKRKENVNSETRNTSGAIDPASAASSSLTRLTPITLPPVSVGEPTAPPEGGTEEEPAKKKSKLIGESVLDKNGNLKEAVVKDWLRHLNADIEDGGIWCGKCRLRRGGTETSEFLSSDIVKMEKLLMTIRAALQNGHPAQVVNDLICSKSTKDLIEGYHLDVATAVSIVKAKPEPTKPKARGGP
jgi:hypothetical protein